MIVISWLHSNHLPYIYSNINNGNIYRKGLFIFSIQWLQRPQFSLGFKIEL